MTEQRLDAAAAMNDHRSLLFNLLAHLMSNPSAPLPAPIRAWLLAGIAEYLARPTTLDNALRLRGHGRPSVAREYAVRRRNEALRSGVTRTGASVPEVQAAIRRHRRRAPGRPPASELDAAIAAAGQHATLPESAKQLKRILATP